jgi:hypothetical protein
VDLAKPISFNGVTTGLTLTGGKQQGIQFVKINFSPIAQVGYFDKTALQDGMDAADTYLAQRTVNIDAAVYGSTVGAAWDQYTALMDSFDPINCYDADPDNDGFLAFDYYRPTANVSTWPVSAYPNGIPMRMYLRPDGPPQYPVPLEASVGVNIGGLALRTSIRLVAKDPRQYLQTTQSITINTASADVTATHRGTHPVYPVLTFSMSASGSTAARFLIENQSVRLDLSTTTTGTFTVDWATGQIEDANGDLANRLFNSSFAQGFETIKGGGTRFLRTDQTGISSGTLVWREAWL